MSQNKEADMKFSAWGYTRPDYSEVKKKVNDCKSKMRNAISYQMFHDAWLSILLYTIQHCTNQYL